MMAGVATTEIPLKSFNHIKTSDPAVLEAGVNRYYAGAKIELVRGARNLNILANRRDFSSIGLAYSRHQARIRFRIPQLQTYDPLFAYRGSAAVRSGRANIVVAGQHGFVGSNAEPVNLDYAPEFEHLILTVDPSAMARKFEAMNGEPAPNRLAFDPACDFGRPEAENLRRMFMFMIEQADSRTTGFHPLALAEFEQTVIVAFLSALRHNFSHLLHRRGRAPAPWQVRQAEEYIDANWDQPLTIEALALVTSISTRSLFLSFQKSRGYSPMDFVKRVRLTHAKAMLERPEETTSVTHVAFACGFGNLGHFAKYYRQHFGEVPSATLQRSQRAFKVWKS
jgi:AraC-like DNA-binding protein